MKKRNIICAAVIAMAAMLTGCSDFLEEHNRNDLSTDNGFYDTEAGFESLINSCYTPMRLWGGKVSKRSAGEPL